MAYAYRARFKKDIVAEFLPPGRPSRKVIIFCGGMPGMPSKPQLLEFLSKKGYWTFNPRYRGTWESEGLFLKYSPEKDILDIIDQLPKGFKEVYGGKKFKLKPSEIYIFGVSFGGTVALMASKDRRIKKVVALSPVVDWRVPSKAEPIDWTARFTKEAFGEAYRTKKKDWMKLKTGKFMNPTAELKKLDGRKLFLFAAKDDEVISWRSVEKFTKQTGAKLKLLKRGGHMSSIHIMKSAFWKEIKKFLRS